MDEPDWLRDWDSDRDLGRFRIDWERLYTGMGDEPEHRWLVEPFLAAGRAHALYAPAKVGKSLLALHVAAAVATGRGALDQQAGPRRPVVYVDYEMSPDDVLERLELLGYDEPDELANLHYVLLPDVGGLDSREGGQALAGYAMALSASLVVIDTTGRSVDGPENEADTYLAYYRHTAMRLKLEGITTLRLDHAGKDLSKGMRGTSAKNDDVDVVWQMTRSDGGVRLRATHRRMSWVPEEFHVRYDEEGDPVLSMAEKGWPARTGELANLLDSLEAPADISHRTASRLLRDHGTKVRNDTLAAVLRWRRDPSRLLRSAPETVGNTPSGTPPPGDLDDVF